MPERRLIEQVPFLGFARRVSDHSGGASYQSDGFVPAKLKVLQHHHAHQVPDMQGIGCRVNPDISHGHFLFKLFSGPGHDIMDHSPPGQLINKVHVFNFYKRPLTTKKSGQRYKIVTNRHEAVNAFVREQKSWVQVTICLSFLPFPLFGKSSLLKFRNGKIEGAKFFSGS